MKRLECIIPDEKERSFYTALMADKNVTFTKVTCHVVGNVWWGTDFEFVYKMYHVTVFYATKKAVIYPAAAEVKAETPEGLLKELEEASSETSFIRMVSREAV